MESLQALPLPDQVEYGLASTSWKWHWRQAGYDPYKWWPGTPHRHPKQIEFLELTERARALITGVGFGKSKLGAAATVQHVIEHPGACAIVATPNYPMMRRSTFPMLVGTLDRMAIHRRNDQEKVIELVNDSSILFVSMDDPNSARGPNASWLWADECSFMPESAFEVLLGRLRLAGVPRRAIITTTPKGKNWVWDRFVGPKKTDNYAIIRATSFDNPYNPEDFLQGLREGLGVGSRAYRQEALGEFVQPSGTVHEGFDRTIHVKRDLWKTYGERCKSSMWYAHDWGHSDPAVVLVCGYNDRRLYVFDEFYEQRQTIDDITEAIIGKNQDGTWPKSDAPLPGSFYHTYAKGEHICDPENAENITTLNRRGMVARGGNNSVDVGLAEVDSRLVVQPDGLPGVLIDERCVKTINDMEQYSYPEGSDKKTTKAKPLHPFSHAPSSLRYLLMELRDPASFSLTRKLDGPKRVGKDPWKLIG